MQLQFTDFNGADALCAGEFADRWAELQQALTALPLHLKASDQDGIQGRAIFDPVGTNGHIAAALASTGWRSGIAIPDEFDFLGTDIDFGKRGVIIEAQFSNYPFLLNNTVRSELFFRAGTVFHELPTRLVCVVTKAGMFPSSNSTLYYEQAVRQLNSLAGHHVFTIPMRLIGLFSPIGQTLATWTEYSAARYSRTVVNREDRAFLIANGPAGKCRISPLQVSSGV